MNGYEQMSFDVTLESDRELKENIDIAVQFACRQLGEAKLHKVNTRHEGYGIAVQSFGEVSRSVDSIKNGMKQFQQILPASDAEAIQAASSLFNSASELAFQAVAMAAQANRIMEDLYGRAAEERTPIEDYIDAADYGFEEAETAVEAEE